MDCTTIGGINNNNNNNNNNNTDNNNNNNNNNIYERTYIYKIVVSLMKINICMKGNVNYFCA
jgi:hypothetical protein